MIGDRLRELRQSRNMTLKQLADETGLSVTFLSLVEREKASISVDNLARIAQCYGIRLVQLFEGLDDNPIFVTRREQIQQTIQNASGHSAFALLSPRHEARMEPLLVQVEPGSGDNQYRTHDGDGFIYVLEGSMQIFTEGQESVILNKGDTGYYSGMPGHMLRNNSQTEVALILMVTSPPTSIRDDVLDGRRGLLLQTEE